MATALRGRLEVLLGAEVDFIPGRAAEIMAQLATYDLDYALGSVHFLGEWGFDYSGADWAPLDRETRFGHYARYFQLLREMAQSRLFEAAAHLDLVKLFSIEDFHAWLDTDAAWPLIDQALEAMADAGMALEVSSAGLRKPCREIYPGPRIMTHARSFDLPLTFASDAHLAGHVAHAFPRLLAYAASHGFERCVVFEHGQSRPIPLTSIKS